MRPLARAPTRRRRIPGLVIVLGLLLTTAFLVDLVAAPEDVSVGDIRAIVSRDGANLREKPSGLARPAAALPHAARVRVEEVRGRWIRVVPLAQAAGTAGRGGWLRTTRTVEPMALTMAGKQAARRGRTTGGISSTEISAAGRQFDEATEDGYRQTKADLQRAYPLVDRIEEQKPDEEALRRFLLEGRLGRPATTNSTPAESR